MFGQNSKNPERLVIVPFSKHHWKVSAIQRLIKCLLSSVSQNRKISQACPSRKLFKIQEKSAPVDGNTGSGQAYFGNSVRCIGPDLLGFHLCLPPDVHVYYVFDIRSVHVHLSNSNSTLRFSCIVVYWPPKIVNEEVFDLGLF